MSGRRYDKKKGKCCLVTLSAILFILSLLLLTGSYLLISNRYLPEEIKKDNGFYSCLIVIGVVLAVYSLFGLFSSCGGCMIYVFSPLTTLLTIVFAAGVGLSIYMVVASSVAPFHVGDA